MAMESLSLIVSPLLQVVLNKLASPIIGKIITRQDFNKEIIKLQEKLPIIQAVIEDAEDRQHKEKRIKIWLIKLKDVAYDADDLLDQISAQVLRGQSQKEVESRRREIDQFLSPYRTWSERRNWRRRKQKIQIKIKSKVQMSSLTLKLVLKNFKLSRRLKEIRERLDDIVREIGDFQLKEIVGYKRIDSIERRETGPRIDDSEVYGRREDVEKLVEMLLSSSNTNVHVIPIVGIGGIGKTTIAQLTYSDNRVARHFDLRMWISVSDNFSPRKIMAEMLDYATEWNGDSRSQLGLLQSKLGEALYGKRFLLVLDDMWNDDPDEWDKVRNMFGGGADGSKVIVTTRSQKVASIISTTPPYHLEALNEDDCWILFKKRAFADGEEDHFPYLLPIAKQIVDKCKGLPLAAKVLGSLMRFKREEREWLHVQESEIWNLDGGENRIISVLRLSFNHLPSHLKRCFAYCAVFPKNYRMSKEKLIHQWNAEGLIQFPAYSPPDHSHQTLEDIGNDYFSDLLMMSLLEEVKRDDDSCTIEYRMHDLIHDLVKCVAGDEFLAVGNTSQQRSPTKHHSMPVICDGFAKSRHALVDCNFRSNVIPEPLCGAKKLRTLHLFSLGDISEKAIRNLISSFKFLRILNMSGLGIKKLHRSIGDLIFLRYLDLSYTPIEKLPTTVCCLYKLQTLDLSGCCDLQELPRGMIRLIDLRHLNIKDCTRLTHLPAYIGALKNLQTLPIFIVGQGDGHHLAQLRFLRLKGELKIKHLKNLQYQYITITYLEHMQLDSLGLSWGDIDAGKLNRSMPGQTRQTEYGGNTNPEEKIPLRPPNCGIKRFLINGYQGTLLPRWMNLHTLSLSNLRKLELINCPRCESLPTLGDLPVLKVLYIEAMDSVLRIGSEFYGESRRSFSSLNELSLRDFPNLKSWESIDVTEAFTCLNRLTVINCPLLISMPWFPSLRYLEVRNCNPLILRSAAELESLSTLFIENFPELDFIPKTLLRNKPLLRSLTVRSCPKLRSMPTNFGELRALKSLIIGWCEELETLPSGLTNLTSLETLEIIECPRLGSLPTASIEGLSSLRSLSIENCNGFSSLPIAMLHNTALERLTIMYCSNLTSLPNDLQHLSTLRSLTILSCTKLASLPEGLKFVTTLQNLEIHSCPKFKELPQWVENLIALRSLAISDCKNIKSLPEGLQPLTALQHLSIRDCPDLENRCEKGKGADWQKISHVPYVYVGSSAPQRQRRDIASSSSVL